MTPLSNGFFVYAPDPRNQPIPGVISGARPAFRSHPHTEGWIRNQGTDRIGERLDIPGFDENARLPILDDVGNAAYAGRNDGQAGGHGLQEDDTKRFE